jgi:hypothetical protein
VYIFYEHFGYFSGAFPVTLPANFRSYVSVPFYLAKLGVGLLLWLVACLVRWLRLMRSEYEELVTKTVTCSMASTFFFSKLSALCSWHKTKSHICLHRQSFVEWLNLEGIGDKKKKKSKSLRNCQRS